jgi:ribosomal protein S18 acetylase RimI-like enzyme
VWDGERIAGQALHALQTRRIETVRLHTLNENTPAQALYTRLGFRRLKEFPRYRKPLL